jgi:hypothetical protein
MKKSLIAWTIRALCWSVLWRRERRQFLAILTLPAVTNQ